MPCHPKPLLRFGSSQPPQVCFAETERTGLGDLGVGPADLGGVRAATTVPPLAKRQSMPSAAAARPTSSTVPCMASCIALAAPAPWSRAMTDPEAENNAEHQPPFLPEAPKPPTGPPEGNAGARRRPEQVVRSPKPGEPGAHHRNVDVDIPVQASPRGQFAREPVPPKRQGPQAHLIRSVHARFMILEPRPGVATQTGFNRRTEMGGPLSAELRNFIHGEQVSLRGSRTAPLVKPSTGEVFAEAPLFFCRGRGASISFCQGRFW